ncbi:MAG: hypothetical protein CMM50_08345 [Rhodospirillaceae bacterium]|nr:hypothetical protein [Rhodospirillaceae bacterium]|tara:strand:- start:562 stop:1218 length:657 start_codon:yes stop_codon:yes gene_type:complete
MTMELPTARSWLVRGFGAGARPDGTHHATRYRRFVSLMKFVLPLSALGLALLVFVWPNLSGDDLGFRLDFSSADYAVDGTVQMTKPHFVGVDKNGQPFAVSAEIATRAAGNPDMIALDSPQADMTSSEGEWIALTAEKGNYDRKAEIIELVGSVSLYSASGLEFHTERAEVDLAQGVASGEDPVDGQGPWGLIKATGFRYAQNDGRLEFFGRPRMTLF